jgi:hypothetical protein
MRTLFPGARLGSCLRHALNKLPSKLMGLAAPVRKGLRSQFHALLYRCRMRTSLRVVSLGQRLRRFADHITATAGADHGEHVRQWFQAKKAGWYAVLADPQIPASSTLLDQAHNAMDRKLFAMKGFHHPSGSQQAFLTGWAHLYNLVPYQRRAQHAGQCGVEVEGGRVPTAEWRSKEAPCCLSAVGFIPAPPHTGQARFRASGAPTIGLLWLVRYDSILLSDSASLKLLVSRPLRPVPSFPWLPGWS